MDSGVDDKMGPRSAVAMSLHDTVVVNQIESDVTGYITRFMLRCSLSINS